MGVIKYNITKEFLYKEYITNKKSQSQIARIIGCDRMTIGNNLRKHHIKTRTISLALIGINTKFSKIFNKRFPL